MGKPPWQIEPLGPWNRPITKERRSTGVFRASWDATLRLLLDEIDHLDPTGPIVLAVDVQRTDLRLDGMLKARAQVGFPGVVVSFTSRRLGPLSYATDAYEQRYYSDMPSWQANVRAIALSLGALRAVDRYGCTASGEQYAGWRAIEAAPVEASALASADAALRWMREETDLGRSGLTADASPISLYRALARRFHPDGGGDPASWTRLQEAYKQLAEAGLL